MKTFIVALTVLIATMFANCQLEKEILEKRIQECFSESKVPEDLQQFDPTDSLDNPKLKCFSACMMKKKGTMKNGKIDPEKQLATMHPESYETIKEIVNSCSVSANQQGDECEIAYTYVKCLISNVGVYQG